jgi:hypothetical protein
MTDEGLDLSSGTALGGFAIFDPAGDYASASADLGTDPEAAAALATRTALARAGRVGEAPDLVWMTAAPGREEAVLAGIKQVVGPRTLIVGGSAGDDDLTGGWSQFSTGSSHAVGVTVSVLFPSGPVTCCFMGDHAPTRSSGIVTAARGRVLLEIDDRPAADVYAEWSRIPLPDPGRRARPVLTESLYWPLGRVAGHLSGTPLHLVAHPAEIRSDGSVLAFAEFVAGDRIWQMMASTPGALPQAERVAHQARAACETRPLGALLVICGGAVKANRHRIERVQQAVLGALGPVPFLGLFTYGEQGAFPGGQSLHGNLMMSCTLFGAPRSDQTQTGQA